MGGRRDWMRPTTAEAGCVCECVCVLSQRCTMRFDRTIIFVLSQYALSLSYCSPVLIVKHSIDRCGHTQRANLPQPISQQRQQRQQAAINNTHSKREQLASCKWHRSQILDDIGTVLKSNPSTYRIRCELATGFCSYPIHVLSLCSTFTVVDALSHPAVSSQVMFAPTTPTSTTPSTLAVSPPSSVELLQPLLRSMCDCC